MKKTGIDLGSTYTDLALTKGDTSLTRKLLAMPGTQHSCYPHSKYV